MASRGPALLRFALRTLTAAFFLLAAGVLLSQFRMWADRPATLGSVEEVVIRRAGDPDDSRAPGERFQPAVFYRYEVDGTTLEGERITVFEWIYRNEERARFSLERSGIRRGARVPVYYNPDDPSEALLVRSIPWGRGEVILAILFLAILPLSVVLFSLMDLVRGGRSRHDDESRGRYW
jgi:hypothetical protein